MTISELTLKTRDEEFVRRFEVFTGTGRRRDGSDGEKARIATESYSADLALANMQSCRRNPPCKRHSAKLEPTAPFEIEKRQDC